LGSVRLRLSRLYDAVETGKLSLDDLTPRIRKQRAREVELSKMRLGIESEMLVQSPNHVNVSTIWTHAKDLKNILEEADLVTSKEFLETLIIQIKINGNEVTVQYTLPKPPQNNR